jgi:tryptophan halogenase
VSRRVQEVVVVGADAPAWMAAAALQRSLGGAGVRLRVIELPGLLQAVDAYSARPELGGFHYRLGLEEELLFSLCNATPVIGQRYSNWSGGAPPFIVGYDQPAPAAADLAFTQYWIKGRQKGLRTAFESFSLGAMAAKAGRVPLATESTELRSTFGYNIDARAYTALLRQFVINGGVEAKATRIGDVQLEDDRIAALILADGERVEADLFVDASGSQAVLIGRMPNSEFRSWREWLPCDRMIVASAKPLRPHPAFGQISAFRHGWVGLLPLQDRTALVAVYDSRQTPDQEVLDSLPVLAQLPIDGDAAISALTTGIRERSWVGNCVAVGESAFSLEPLDAVQLHITHNCVSQLMALFPATMAAFPEAELYNRIVQRVATNLRDLQLAHYKLNRRFDEPLWDRCRDQAVPGSLQRKLDVFAARGRVPLYDDDAVQEEGWESMFIGHGLIPQSYDPRVDAKPEPQQIAEVQDRMAKIVELVRAMPPVDEFLTSSLRHGAAELANNG